MSSTNRLNPQNSTRSKNSASKEESLKFFSTSKKRIYTIIGIFIAVISVLFLRLVWLQIIDAENSKKAAVETRTISYKTNPKRGTIYDRNGNVLAFSKEAKTIYANPSEIENVNEVASKLASIIGGKTSDYVELISDHDKKFVYIKRQFDVDLAKKVQAENINGIYLQEDSKREYPYGKNAGQIIGACNIDGNGLCGLELYYDDILRGSSGKIQKQQGLDGMPIPGGTVQNTEVIDGQDIMITIDIELQQKLENYLLSYNKKKGSSSMSAVVCEPRTGEIFAAASLPLLDPAKIENAQKGSTELKCVSALHEPGSTFKAVTATSLFEGGLITPDTQFYCPVTLAADEYKISDVKKRGATTYTFRQIMENSSNVGVALASEKLGRDKLFEKIKKYNLNEPVGIDFPGDTNGFLSDVSEWSKVQAYNISFGQGISITPMQLIKFYGALANNGVETTPHFLMRYLQSEKDEEYPTYDVVENKDAIPVVTDVLKTVVNQGTGTEAKIDPYGVAGKTGTGEIADNTGSYIKGKYFATFIGFLSQASSPLLCYVGADDAPEGMKVTDVFKDIMTFAIERFKVVAK